MGSLKWVAALLPSHAFTAAAAGQRGERRRGGYEEKEGGARQLALLSLPPFWQGKEMDGAEKVA